MNSVVVAQAPPQGNWAEHKKLAQAFFDAILNQDYAAAGKEFDETMKKTLPTDKLETTWKGVIEKVGAFSKQTGMRAEQGSKYTFVYITCQFEKAKLDLRVVFDGTKKIAGFSLVPPKGSYEFKPPAYAKPDMFMESKIEIGSGEWALPGTLTLPKGAGPFPGVVLVHGSGPHDRDETIGPNKPFRDLAWGLASRGIAVLRYEKRTKEHAVKCAALKSSLTIKEESIDDALAAVALLRQNKAIDPNKIFLLGHSLGALVAPRIAEQEPALAGLLLLAANTRPLEDLILEQFTYIYSLDGASTDKHKEELDKLRKQIDLAKSGRLGPDTKDTDLPLGVPAAYWLALRAYDPLATATKIKQPMVILQGERDYQVTMEDFQAWKRGLAARKNVQLKSYPRLNHLFMDGEGKAKPAEYEKPGHVAAEVIDDVVAWLKSQSTMLR